MQDEAETPALRTVTQHSGADFERGQTGRPRGEQIAGVEPVDAR